VTVEFHGMKDDGVVMMRSGLLAILAVGILTSQVTLAADFRIGVQEDADVLDPHRARTTVGRMVFTSLCDKLVDVTDKLEIAPQLASSWSWSPDNKTLTFKLRTDVQFHDGTKFDAAAVKANLDRALTLPDSQRKGELGSIDRVEVIDPSTVVLHLKQPDATLLAQLSDRAGMMLSPATFNSEDVGRKPICSGPYRFVERVQNDRIVLEKFADYRDAKDYQYDRVVFRPIPDTTVRLANLRAGDLELVERLNPSDAEAVKADKSLKFLVLSGLGFQNIVINVGAGPRADGPLGKDKLVRQAFQAAIGRDVINEVIGHGLYNPAQHPFPPASPYFDKQYPATTRDVTKAKALLAQAKQPEVAFELSFGNTTITASLAEMIQAMAGEAGFKISLRPMEFSAMLAEMQKGNFQASLSGWSGRIDPDGNIHQFVTCKGTQNDSKYCNPEVDRLLNEARLTPDVEARKKLYNQAMGILQNELPIIYTYYSPLIYAVSNRVADFKPYPDGMIRLRGVHPAK
jgi:peptide/nickel transport system substrate-binding protein